MMTDERFIAQSEAVCFSKPWTADDIHALMISGDCVYEVIPDVGYALGRVSYEEADLYRIAVLPEKRRQGAGKRLLESFVKDCAQKGAKSIYLDVRSKNEAAVSMYEGFGFERIWVRKMYYGDDDALIYRYCI